MSESTAAFIAGLIIAGFAGILIACAAHETAEVEMKREAVNANAAEWTVDKDGQVGFRWLPAKQPEPAR